MVGAEDVGIRGGRRLTEIANTSNTTADFEGSPDACACHHLSDDTSERHVAARAFALDVIKQTYGVDYREEWHADLDSLLDRASWYRHEAGGSFFVVEYRGDLIATGGLHALTRKTTLTEIVGRRYVDIRQVGHLARVYVREDMRNRGYGSLLVAHITRAAQSLRYAHLNLHADRHRQATIRFWRRHGFNEVGRFGSNIDFSRELIR